MPRTEINESAVFAVCDRIYIETGRDATYQDITNTLGGSNSTVKPFLQSWLEQTRPARQPMPDDLQATAGSFLQVIWGHALVTAQKAMLPKIHECEEAYKRCHSQLAHAMETISEVDQDRDRLKAEIATLLATTAALHFKLGANDALIKRCESFEQMNEALIKERDQALELISRSQGQIDVLERQLARIHDTITSNRRSTLSKRSRTDSSIVNQSP